MKDVNDQNLWTFELGSPQKRKVFMWIIVRFEQRDRQNSQNLNNGAFCRLPVTNAQCINGTEKYPDAGISSNYDDDDDCYQGYGQIKEALRALTKYDILQPDICDQDFRSNNVNDAGENNGSVGYNLCFRYTISNKIHNCPTN